MALMIGFALSPAIAAARRGEAPPPPERRLRLDEPSRERVVYDSGAAFGRSSARVPVRGTTEPGAEIEARAVGGGREVVGWTEIGAASASGAFELELEVPKGLAWCMLEARLRDAPAVRGATTRPFAVGHVLAIWGQSEVEQAIKPALSKIPAEELDHEDRVSIVFHDRVLADANIGRGAAGVVIKHLTRDDPHTAACAAMANVLTDLDGDAVFRVVFQCQSGTPPGWMFQDDTGKSPGDDKTRFWADDLAVHEAAAADGAHVGAACMSWFNSPSNLAWGYDDYMAAAMFRRNMAGNPVAIPGSYTWSMSENNNSRTESFEHCWADLYDYRHTRWVPYGPHRFDPREDMVDAVGRTAGGTDSFLRNIERCRITWRQLVADDTVHGGAMLPITVEPLNYVNGEDKGANWSDLSHPADDTEDGLPQFLRLTAHAWARSTGITDWTVPEFDAAELGPSGAWVELSAGTAEITTTRLARGEGGDRPPATHPHQTEVLGFEYDGVPIHRALVVGGKVRVFPNEGVFGADVLDRLTYLRGGATGMLARPEDYDAELWKDLAIVDVGAARVGGIAVRPLILPGTVTTTSDGGSGGGDGGSGGGAGSTAFFTREAQAASLADPDPIGSGVTGITAELRLRIRPQSGYGFRSLFELTPGLVLDAETRAKKRQIRLTLKAPGNVKLFEAASVTKAFDHDEWTTIRVSVLRDLPGGEGTARVSVESDTRARKDVITSGPGNFTNAAGAFDAGQSLAALSGAVPLDVASIRIWKGAREDGELPAGVPYKVIEGDAAAVNADGWKAGDDPFA